MIGGIARNDAETLSKLVMYHSQKVMDHTKAVPNPGLAKRHREFAEVLKKAQAVFHSEEPSCDGCVRNGKPDVVCSGCSRDPRRSDNFKRRAT